MAVYRRRAFKLTIIFLFVILLIYIFSPKPIVPDVSEAKIICIRVRRLEYRDTNLWPYKLVSNYDESAVLNYLHNCTEYQTLYNVDNYFIKDVDIEINLNINGKPKEVLLGKQSFSYCTGDMFQKHITTPNQMIAEILKLLDPTELYDTVGRHTMVKS